MEISAALLSAVEKMPPFPQSFHKLLAITYGSPDEARDMVEVISHDPVITLKILRLVNSAYFGLSREIASVEHAMSVLGPNTIRNMMIAISALGVMPRKSSAGFNTDQYLLHSLATAAMARQLAQHLGDASPLEAYLAGLLHDFGQVLCAITFPEAVAQARAQTARGGVHLCEAEVQSFGVDHAELGATLARQWQLPTRLVDAIQSHHQSPPAGGLGRCLFLANQLTKHMQIGLADLPVEPLPQDLAPSLGASYDEIFLALPKLQTALTEAEGYLSAGR